MIRSAVGVRNTKRFLPIDECSCRGHHRRSRCQTASFNPNTHAAPSQTAAQHASTPYYLSSDIEQRPERRAISFFHALVGTGAPFDPFAIALWGITAHPQYWVSVSETALVRVCVSECRYVTAHLANGPTVNETNPRSDTTINTERQILNEITVSS